MATTFDYHEGGKKRLSDAINDFSLTMQHALRHDITHQLEKRAADEAGVLPPLSAPEMFDFLMDSDPEFLNWCFPFCAVRLTPENLGHLHAHVLSQYRLSIKPTEHASLQ